MLVAILLVVFALPLFLNTAGFKSTIESSASKSLGRSVQMQNLKLSLFSGGLLAAGVTIADDPAFSAQPFLSAQSVKVQVALWPLLTRRAVEVGGFVLSSPRITLLRNGAGVWNYSSIGRAAGQAKDSQTQSTFPNLTVGEVKVVDGQVTVTMQPLAGTTGTQTTHVYEQVGLQVKGFSFANVFPFTASVGLPGEGTMSASGTVGPINQVDAANTPFSIHLEAKHIDPLAAGLVSPSSGISGQLDSLTLDAAWSGQQLRIRKLLIDGPHVTLVQASKTASAPQTATSSTSTMLTNLAVDSFELNNGSVTIASPGQTQPVVYSNVHATLSNVSSKTPSPFNVTAQLPGGGSLSANGNAGPFQFDNSLSTPVGARVSLKQVNLGSTGLIAPDAGILGVADLDATITSNGQVLNATGTANITGLQLAKTGTPSRTPVGLQFALTQNEQAVTGVIQRGAVTIGHNTINVSGTYQRSGSTTAINLKVAGQSMSINELQAFLPSVGVKLPRGSQLQGGTLTVNLNVSGSTANPIVSGPVSLSNTQLAGFDLSSKLTAVSRLTGSRPSSDTVVRSLSMNLRSQGERIQTDRIALDVPSLGTATGSGSVDHGALDYRVVLKPVALGKALGGLAPAAGGGIAGQLLGMIPGGGSRGLGGLLSGGIPVSIGGTTTNPTFAPDLGGLTRGAAAQKGRSARSPATNDPLGQALGGLLGSHH